MATPITRRNFLGSLAAGGTVFILLGNSRSARTYAANERVNLAIVGVSGRGSWFSETMPKLANVVAMCDVNERRAAPYYKAIPQARTFHDFRRMFDEMGRQIDAVTIATPDHTHAVITAAAIRQGKHVLCEKPLTHDVFEARTLRMLAREYKVATQMGNQGTASEAFRRGVELIQAGVLGPIREVHAWNTGGGAVPPRNTLCRTSSSGICGWGPRSFARTIPAGPSGIRGGTSPQGNSATGAVTR